MRRKQVAALVFSAMLLGPVCGGAAGAAGGPEIVEQPKDVTAERLGEPVTVQVQARGEGLSWQWYVRERNGESFVPSRITGPKYQVTMTPERAGRRLYCEITDAAGRTVRSDTVTIDVLRFPDAPRTAALAAARKRALWMLEQTWTPAGTVPGQTGSFPAGEVQTGLPYSSVKEKWKYLGQNVSLHTFLTAAANPWSLLYTENISRSGSVSGYGFSYRGQNCATYYGVVCSSFVDYALDLGGLPIWASTEYAYLCRQGVLEQPADQSVSGLRILDILWRKGHVALVTDIERDAAGAPVAISVTEASPPRVKQTVYTPDQFQARVDRTQGILYRVPALYDGSAPAGPVPDRTAPEGPDVRSALCTYAGDRAVFRLGEPVVLNYSAETADYDALEIIRGGAVSSVPLRRSAALNGQDVTALCREPGLYRARLAGEDMQSVCTSFEVVDAGFRLTRAGSRITLDFPAGDRAPACCQLCYAGGGSAGWYEFTEAEQAAGRASFDGAALIREQHPELDPAKKTLVRLFFPGTYGVAVSEMKG